MGFAPDGENVVDAVVHHVYANSVESVHQCRQHQLCSRRVGAGDQDGLTIALQLVHSTEETNAADDLRPKSPGSQLLDALLGSPRGPLVYPGGKVGLTGHGASS